MRNCPRTVYLLGQVNQMDYARWAHTTKRPAVHSPITQILRKQQHPTDGPQPGVILTPECSPNPPKLVKKVYDCGMTSLLQLLATRKGTAQVVRVALEAGAEIGEVHPRTKEGVLHVLLRRCVLPLELYDTVKVLVKHGADVNLLDYRGATPLSLLVLHINHGLRYHSYPLPEVQRLEDLAAPKHDLQKLLVDLDANYQQQVYQSLELLLRSGADVNAPPDVVPALPAYTEWVQAYEHKLMQQEGRWHLLGHDTSMEFSTYNIFNPISSHRCLNEQKLTPLHLAAWRGDAKCIRLLLSHGADAKAITDENKRGKDRGTQRNSGSSRNGQNNMGAMQGNVRYKRGRGVLHFLYLYCNKPSDLVKATRALLAAGADPNVSHQGEYPAHYLIPHVLVKRTYHQYLSAAFLMDELQLTTYVDTYVPELSECLTLLSDAGMMRGPVWDSLLLKLFDQFEQILINTDKTFQPHGHYLVPYTFHMDALTQFAGFLIAQGCKVTICDAEGQTPLHHLVSCIHNLSTDPALNSNGTICHCFRTLLDAGADCNKKDIYKKTPVFATVLLTLDAINCSDTHGLDLFSDVLDLMTSYGGDLNIRDCLSVTPLSRTVSSLERPLRCRLTRKVGANLKRFLEVLLMNGADPNSAWSLEEDAVPIRDGQTTYALDILFDLHFDLQLHDSDHDPECVLPRVIAMVSGCMQQSVINQVVKRLWAKACPELGDTDTTTGCSHEEQQLSRCADCALVVHFSQHPFSLKLACRQVLIMAMRGCYKKGVPQLPLPAEIKRYLLDLTTV